MEQIKLAVEKYLKKKKEKPLIQLKIENYNKSNFYFAIVYNKKINAFKVLFLPIDVIDLKHIDEYVCYQFINYMSVEYILKALTESSGEFVDEKDRFRENKKISNYKIEIDVHLLEKDYVFKTTRYIPKDWVYLFDVIVTLFEHCPNVVNELCEEILMLYRNESLYIPYQESFDFKLLRGDDWELNEKIKGKKLAYESISYLERIENKYFSIIDGHLVIIEYEPSDIVNTYCDVDDYNDYVYTVIVAIRDDVEKKFCKLMLTDSDEAKAQYYLCYGLEDNNFKVIHGYSEKLISINNYKDGKIKFIEDDDNLIKKQVVKLLKD